MSDVTSSPSGEATDGANDAEAVLATRTSDRAVTENPSAGDDISAAEPAPGAARSGRATSAPAVNAAGEVADAEIPVEVDAGDAGDDTGKRIAALQAQVTTLEKEKKDNWDSFLRSAADLENLRKRAKRDADEARADMRGRVLREILPIVDNLERAVGHAAPALAEGSPPAEPNAILDGVRLVLRQFTQALEKLDVSMIEADGKPFDPNQHEAISQQESDAHPPGTVVQVLQKGYKSGDRLLRPALVVVAKAKAEG